MKPMCVHDLRQRDNVFVAIVLLCLIPHIKYRVLFRRIETTGEFGSTSCCLSRESTSSLLRLEKSGASNAFRRNETGTALESSCRPRETENPLSIFAKVVPYV